MMTERISGLHVPTQTAPRLSPIFIGGHYRSGSTLLRVILNRHPNIACGPEGQLLDRTAFLDFHRFLENTWGPRLQDYDLNSKDIDCGVAAFINEFFSRYAARRGKRRWAEKTSKNVFSIAYYFRLFPDARFIHLIRDPRDIHCSVVAKAHTSTPRWLNIDAERTATRWVRCIQSGMQWRADPRYLEARYEDLVHEPVELLKQVFDFVNEPWDERVMQPEPEPGSAEQPNVLRPIFKTSVGRWQTELAEGDIAAIEEISGRGMEDLGYRLSRRYGRERGDPG